MRNLMQALFLSTPVLSCIGSLTISSVEDLEVRVSWLVDSISLLMEIVAILFNSKELMDYS